MSYPPPARTPSLASTSLRHYACIPLADNTLHVIQLCTPYLDQRTFMALCQAHASFKHTWSSEALPHEHLLLQRWLQEAVLASAKAGRTAIKTGRFKDPSDPDLPEEWPNPEDANCESTGEQFAEQILGQRVNIRWLLAVARKAWGAAQPPQVSTDRGGRSDKRASCGPKTQRCTRPDIQMPASVKTL